MSTPEEIKAEYTSSLADLTFNSKPLINVLTMLADENSPNAKVIVEAIETHLSKVPIDVKLPMLYLIDCIVKNVGGTYTTLFSQNIVSIFCGVFTAVDEKTRAEMFKLRQTWNEVFPQKKLYAIDVQINLLDPAWPVTAQPPSNSIYFNPKFLQTNAAPSAKNKPETQPNQMIVAANAANVDKETLLMQEKLIQKQKVLLELQQKKLELEVLQTQVKLQEQIKHNVPVVPVAGRPQNILLKPEVAKQLVPTLTRKGNAIGANLPQKSQPAANNGTRINPVNSDLIAAAAAATAGNKPAIRDPRLLRQQQKSNVAMVNPQQQQQQRSGVFADKAKAGVRKTRADPRLLNKDDAKKSGGSDSGSVKSSSSSSLDSPAKHKKKKTAEEKRASPKKNRNYVRRLVPSTSPESRQDEDLRSFGPPEKQPRLQSEAVEEKATNMSKMVTTAKGMDVDLRQLPATIVGKKRPSTESPDHSSAKKSKSEILDKLFGDEDTDLRRLPLEQPQIVPEIRPPTPPPPIISSNDSPKEKPREKDSPQKSNLDAVRAKLANATNRDKVMSKSFNKKKLKASEDQDLRYPKPSSAAINSAKIIISPEDENNIKHGNLTQEQSKQLLQKIVMQMEKNKLIEAKKKDKEDSFNVSLQPISDEDLVDSDEETKTPAEEQVREESLIPFKDKDERLNVATAPPMQQPPPPFFARSSGWRGGRRPWPDNGPRMPMWRGPQPNQHHHHHQQPPWRNFHEAPPPSRSPNDQLPDGAVDDDEVKSIAIDGVQKDIRFYGETGIVFVDWDDPRELTFQDDGVRRVTFNEHESYVLGFNRPYEEVTVNGAAHSVRIGAPSREIFIDRVPYECFFGSAGIRIDLDGVPTTVKVEGPPPPVKIGETRRSDMVAGKIKLFIDAKVVVPVFLDARVQKFTVDGQSNNLKFVNALESVLINDVLFNVEYGGLPKPIVIRGKKHFVRFSVLPKGVRPGRVSIAGMEGPAGDCSSPKVADENSRDSTSDPYDPALPIVGARSRPRDVDSPDRNSSSPNTFQNILQQQNLNNLDALSNAMTILGPTMPTRGSYQVENQPGVQGASSDQHQGLPVVPTLNINDLFQKLVASGFVTSSDAKKPAAVVAPVEKVVTKKPPTETVPQPDPSMAPSQNVAMRLKKSIESLRPVSFKKPEQFRIRQRGLYDTLFSGMQCSSCGMRFPMDASIQYSQHLDWHFRQNRKGKRNSRVATSRRWNYSLSDWKNYEEVEDLEEREKNFFDQQKQAEGAAEEDELEAEVPSVAADPDSTTECCAVCHDKFDQFFNEEKEEWHLRNAVRMEEKTYHPICYEDYQQSLMDQTADESKIESVEEKQEDEVIPGLEIVIDDDEDDEEMHDDTDTPEVVSLENDEVPDDEDSRPAAPAPEEEDDDDVILNEVAPIKIVVDDDDEEMPSEEVSSDPESVKVKRESLDDGFVEVSSVSLQNGKQIKIKSEPIDPDDEQLVPCASKDLPAPALDPPAPTEEAAPAPHLDQVSSIDGNLELASNAPVAMPANMPGGNRIRINISKPIPVINKEREVVAETSNVKAALEPFPPGEEPTPAALKPALHGVKLRKLPPVSKGKDLTGLCSIM